MCIMCHTLLDSGYIVINKDSHESCPCGPHSLMGKIEINT